MKSLILLFYLAVFGATVVHATPSHALFDAILKENVDPNGAVNYPRIKEDPDFAKYLAYLEKTDPATFATKEEQLAFWINAYNALAIKGIIDGLSPRSVFSRISYFKTTDYELAGRKINLYDLERDILIPFNEPRIHFAIVCASTSCPKLITEVYTADKLEQQLEASTINFINNTLKNQFDLDKKIASISKIFDWFPEDFAKASGSVQKYLANYVEDDDISRLLAQDGFKVKYLKYDWSLNGTPVK